jgi:MGT family glycosyltransferase
MVAATGAEPVPHASLLPDESEGRERWPEDPIAGMALFSPTFVAWGGYEDDMADEIAAMRASPAAEAFAARFAGWLSLGPLPDGVEVHPSVPQLAVLRHARAFVTHAGMGSTVEALWSGVPTVAIPQAVEQLANAARIAELGAGVHLPREQVTARALGDAVRHVALDPGVAARVAALRDEVRASGGAARAADAVEDALPRPGA